MAFVTLFEGTAKHGEICSNTRNSQSQKEIKINICKKGGDNRVVLL